MTSDPASPALACRGQITAVALARSDSDPAEGASQKISSAARPARATTTKVSRSCAVGRRVTNRCTASAHAGVVAGDRNRFRRRRSMALWSTACPSSCPNRSERIRVTIKSDRCQNRAFSSARSGHPPVGIDGAPLDHFSGATKAPGSVEGPAGRQRSACFSLIPSPWPLPARRNSIPRDSRAQARARRAIWR